MKKKKSKNKRKGKIKVTKKGKKKKKKILIVRVNAVSEWKLQMLRAFPRSFSEEFALSFFSGFGRLESGENGFVENILQPSLRQRRAFDEFH